MAILLLIETATRVCSAALSRDGELLAVKETDQPNAHSARLAVFMAELFQETNLTAKDLDAVAVSRGPGSYTGLRIGVSSAKGVAYAADCPLMAIDTLQILAAAAREKYPNAQYLVLSDARRMEVYAGLYDENLNILRSVQADIVTENYYNSILEKTNKTIAVGDGVEKCCPFLPTDLVTVDLEIRSSAKHMVALAEEKYRRHDFEDTAYFEPFYLKDFVAGKPRVKGLFE